MIWRVGAIVMAALVALPLLGLASSLLTPQDELWRHLADTQLSDIVANTLVLLLVVGLGTTVIGAGTAWLVTMCRFPGSRLLQWALLLPLVLPTYIIGYAYADLLAFAGPAQARSAHRRPAGSAATIGSPISARRAAWPLLFTLVLYPYVYLAARTAFLTQSQASDRGQPHPGPRSVANLLRRRPAAGAPADRRRRGAGAVRSARRLRHRPVLRRADLHDGDLSHLVRPRQSRRRRADRAGPDRHRRAADPDRTSFARPRTLPHRVEPAPPRRSRSSSRPGRPPPRSSACALPVLLGFVVPTIHLAQLAVALRHSRSSTSRFLRDAANSLVLAATAAVIIAGLALFLSYAGRLVRRRALNRLIEFASLGYAIPGAVIAVGILLPLALADHGIDRLSRSLFGLSSGLLLSGTRLRAAARLHGALPGRRPRQHRARPGRHRSGDGRQRARAGRTAARGAAAHPSAAAARSGR